MPTPNQLTGSIANTAIAPMTMSSAPKPVMIITKDVDGGVAACVSCGAKTTNPFKCHPSNGLWC